MEARLSPQRHLIEQSLSGLDRWITFNGWAGYDPYDLRAHPLLASSEKAFVRRAFRQAMLLIETFFPAVPRKLLRIPKEINPKAMGLFAAGYQILHQTTREEKHLVKAREALTWLEQNTCRSYAGHCWGHPFRWQSKVPFPENAPSAVVTAIVGDAFWRFHQMTGNDHYLHCCQSICEFFLHDLNIDELGEERICFSKTPLDHFHIHNGNLFVADFLLKVGKILKERDFISMAGKALAYTLREQNDDGSICYWGKDQGESCRIDHYHSGFEIRCLHSIWKSTGDEQVYSALNKYYKFYCKSLFTTEGLPKMTPKTFYPINIHSCAEAILCHSTLAPDFPEALGYLDKCVPWTLATMQHLEGWFIYMVRKVRGRLDWKLKIPYIRWGEAWMLRALAQYCFLSANLERTIL